MADFKSMLKLDAIMKLSRLKKIIILAVINVVIVALCFNFLIKPTLAERAEVDLKYQELRQQIEENERIASNIPKFKKEKLELEAQLKAALAQLPNKKEIPNLIDSINDAGNESGLTVQVFRPQSEIPQGFYAKVPVSMTVKGSYESLLSFCERISKLPRIVNINNLTANIGSGKGGKGGSVRQYDPDLSSSFTVTTFRFIEEAATPRDKKKRKKRKGKKK